MYLSHPAASERRKDLVGADLARIQRCDWGLLSGWKYRGQRFSDNIEGWRVDEARGLVIVGEQRGDLAAQFLIACADFAEERGARRRLALQRGMIESLHLIPTFRLHGNSGK